MQPPFMHEDWFDQWLYNVIHYPSTVLPTDVYYSIRSFTRLYFYPGRTPTGKLYYRQENVIFRDWYSDTSIFGYIVDILDPTPDSKKSYISYEYF